MPSQRTDRRLLDEVDLYLTPGAPGRDELTVDPYPFYDRLRAADPVHKSAAGPWLLSRFDDVLALLQSPDYTQDFKAMRLAALAPGEPQAARPGLRLIESGMLWRDPPDHTRLRRLVEKAFRASAIKQWEPRIEQIARELLEGLRARPTFDLLHDFSMLLPGLIITEMIGMPPEHGERYAEWAEAAIVVQDRGSSPEDLDRTDRLAEECLAYFDALVDDKRRDPAPDILSALLAADREEDERATHDEIVGMCILLHVAGHETTSNVIANGMYHLITNPDQYTQLRSGDVDVERATEEVLRYDISARQTMPRWAARDTEIAGVPIPAGDQVFGIFGAAHRDPARFGEPHRFDMARPDQGHLAFGFGPHYCLGVRLARVEIGTALQLLAQEFPRLELAGETICWRDSLILRALEDLEVAWA
jgi:pimeloyl-[acyl-carrier protein] synthase